MRAWTRIVIGSALALPCGAAVAQDDEINIMWFGNSHTCGFAGSCPGNTLSVEPRIPEVVRLLAREAGEVEPTNYWQTQNGATLFPAFSVALNRFDELPPESWDFVVMQGNSTENLPVSTGLGNPTRFQNVALCIDRVYRQHSPAVTSVFLQTWARAHEHPNYEPNGGPIESPEAWHSATRFSYQTAHRRILGWAGVEASRVARVGDAFALTDWNNDNGSDLAVISGDNNHATNRGSLLAALVLFGTIYERQDLSSLPIDIENDASDLAQRLRGFGIDNDDWAYVTGIADETLAVGRVGCTLADLAAPYGTTDFLDVLAFINRYQEGNLAADISPEGGDGLLNFVDVLAFVEGFGTPCDQPEPPCE